MSLGNLETDSAVKALDRIVDVWRSGQVLLPKVRRWSAYFERGGCREQNDLDHCYSIGLTGSIVLQKIKPYFVLPLDFGVSPLDTDLIRDCLLVHDHGEAELGKDTLYHLKCEEQDLLEYEAFIRRYDQLDQDLSSYYKKAFLLQFCLKIPNCFPASVRQEMAQLAEVNKMEALIFDAIERWDYVLYAMEQYQQHDNLFLLLGVLYRQKPPLDELAQKIPGFASEIWTWNTQNWAEDLLVGNPQLVQEFLDFAKA